jgi:hypothetical protein
LWDSEVDVQDAELERATKVHLFSAFVGLSSFHRLVRSVKKEDLMVNSPLTRPRNSASLHDADLVKVGHVVYATSDGRYEICNPYATASARDWWVLAHPPGDDDPSRAHLFGAFKSLVGATGFVQRSYVQEDD